MPPQLVKWVEHGQAPESDLARPNNPGYFDVQAHSRGLCPHPAQARYNVLPLSRTIMAAMPAPTPQSLPPARRAAPARTHGLRCRSLAR